MTETRNYVSILFRKPESEISPARLLAKRQAMAWQCDLLLKVCKVQTNSKRRDFTEQKSSVSYKLTDVSEMLTAHVYH
jgi:hypothetical protein